MKNETIAAGVVDHAVDILCWESTREAIVGLVELWNANGIKRETGEVITLSIEEFEPGRIQLMASLTTEAA